MSLAGAQEKVFQVTGRQCVTCEVVLKRIVSLGDRDSSGALHGRPIAIASIASGGFAVVNPPPGGPVLLYGTAGQFVGYLGKKGKGPGEMEMAAGVASGAGRMYAWDFLNARLSVYDLRGRYLYSAFQTAATQAVIDGFSVANVSALTAGNRVAAISIIDSSGRIIRVVDLQEPSNRPEDSWRISRSISAISHGFWSSRVDRYELTRWSIDGKATHRVRRNVKWFPAVETRTAFVRGEYPNAELLGAQEDSHGLLWTFIRVTSPAWREGLGPPRVSRSPNGRPSYQYFDEGKLFDTMIEVIDLKTGKLVASTRQPGYFAYPLGNDLVGSYGQNENGEPIITVWELKVSGKR